MQLGIEVFERNEKVYTKIVPDCSKPTLQGMIRGRVKTSAIANSHGWCGYY